MKPLTLSQITVFLFVLMQTVISSAQERTITGVVRDADSNDPLPFVVLYGQSKQRSVLTDIDGKFSFQKTNQDTALHVEYVSYKKLTVPLGQDDYHLEIKLEPDNKLREVVVLPGENPAHRIIKAATKNAKNNNPEMNTRYSALLYSKFVFTPEFDSVAFEKAKTDTNMANQLNFFVESYLFLMENVTERIHVPPDQTRETVLANKVSGFSNPTFALFSTQLQPFTFYREKIPVVGVNYLNPISQGSTSRYFFQLEDTLFQPSGDTVFVIYFRPSKGAKFDGLAGTLYIHTDGFAIQNVIAAPHEQKELFSFRIQQENRKVDGYWFPYQLNTWILGDENDGGQMVGKGTSYLRDITLGAEVKRRDIGDLAVEFEPGANQQKEEYWHQYRQDSLTDKERNTYRIIDSIGKEINLDKFARLAGILATGKIPVKFVNIDLDKVFDFNNYEGFRLGMGLHTNDKISRKFDVGGYGAYGFRDRAFKYGGDISLYLHRRSETQLKLEASNDVMPTAFSGIPSLAESLLSDASYHEFMQNMFDRIETYKATLSFRAFRHFKFWAAASHRQIAFWEPYYFAVANDAGEQHQTTLALTTLHFTTRINFGEKFMQTPTRRVSLGSRSPIIFIDFAHGLNGQLYGELTYSRLQVRAQRTHTWRVGGKTSLMGMAGQVWGDVPLHLLFNAPASFQMWSISTPSAFETMRVNEMISDRYLMATFYHDFGPYIFGKKKWRPQPAVSVKAMWGDLRNRAAHRQIDFNTPKLGYYEAGLLMNSIIKSSFSGIGLGVFHRFGPYAFTRWQENFVVKLTITFAQ